MKALNITWYDLVFFIFMMLTWKTNFTPLPIAVSTKEIYFVASINFIFFCFLFLLGDNVLFVTGYFLAHAVSWGLFFIMACSIGVYKDIISLSIFLVFLTTTIVLSMSTLTDLWDPFVGIDVFDMLLSPSCVFHFRRFFVCFFFFFDASYSTASLVLISPSILSMKFIVLILKIPHFFVSSLSFEGNENTIL